MSSTPTPNPTSSNMPPQVIPPLPAGANSIMDAGVIKQQQQIQSQMALIGKSGGYNRRRSRGRGHKRCCSCGRSRRSRNYGRIISSNKRRGGANTIHVPSPPSYSVDKTATQNNYTSLTKVLETQAEQAKFDNTVQKAGGRTKRTRRRKTRRTKQRKTRRTKRMLTKRRK